MRKDLVFENKKVLEENLKSFIYGEDKDANGIIVPHSKKEFLGSILGQAYSSISKKRMRRVVVFAPVHNKKIKGIRSVSKIETLLGEANVIKNDLKKIKGDYSLIDQIVFLQKINPKVEILPLIVGKITKKEAKKIAEDFSSLDMVFVFTTNLFCSLDQGSKDDENLKLIKSIEELDYSSVDVCGKYVLKILKELCVVKNWRPELIKYEDIEDGDECSTVGYASFWF